MQSVWLFGYGSLIWRPDFKYVSRHVAWIDGWTRRFWQGSHDHRGVPEAPGRVATLIPVDGARCGGMAFEIAAPHAEDIFTGLDYREKNGYERFQAPLYFESSASESNMEGVFYNATDSNPAFLGEDSIENIASQIAQSHGPSGSNAEYLHKLAHALRDLQIEDPHVSEIERELTRLENTAP